MNKDRMMPAALAAGAAAAALLCGCANVKPWEREKLADPIMSVNGGAAKQELTYKFYSTREGSMGGNAGISGGCGCSK